MLRAAVGERRILINALSWSFGGGNTYSLNLIRELSRDPRGFRFTVLGAQGRFPVDEAGGLDVATVRLPAAGAQASTLFRVAYEETLLPLRARHFDLLYCMADLAPAFGSTPTVVHLRNFHVYDRRFIDTLRMKVLRGLVHLGLRGVRRIVFPSQSAADLISPALSVPADRIAVVPHGVSAEFLDSEASVRPAVPYLFLPALLERHKNVAVLIESLRHVSDPKLEVWIAGHDSIDPGYVRGLRRIADELQLGSRVRFLGPVPYREIFSYYRGAVALVFPSLLETFGHPLLEAMVAGTPIVASDIPTCREVGADVALYFDPHDPVALAAAVERIRSQPGETNRRIEQGRARAARFSWKNAVDQLCVVFEDALRAG
jgi:glycosyltransferase involved in cell wall biosynthesis